MSMQPQVQTIPENRLLASLQVHERNAVQRGALTVACTPGQTLLSANTHTDHVFFPVDAAVALVRTLENGRSVELGIVGNDGMIGCDAFMEAKIGLDEAVVRSAGAVWCMPAEDLRRQFHRGGGLQKALLRFMNAFISQLSQNALCNRFHSIDGRVARWLLMIHDRSAGSDIDVTRGIAGTLKSDAAAVERAVSELIAVKAVRQRRSSIVVTDPGALELRACECYESLRNSSGPHLVA